MGLFGALGRIVQGKPVFEVSHQNQQPPASQPVAGEATNTTQQAPRGPKVIPQVYVERVECRTEGSHLECELTLQNDAQVTIELEKIELMGSVQYLNAFIRPGEEREYRAFSGNRPNQTYNDRCRIFYKDPSGDYFCSEHHIEFQKLSDNTYTINRIRFMPPVRDI